MASQHFPSLTSPSTISVQQPTISRKQSSRKRSFKNGFSRASFKKSYVVIPIKILSTTYKQPRNMTINNYYNGDPGKNRHDF